MDHENQRDIVAAVSHAADMVRHAFQWTLSIYEAPHIVQRPTFGMDGNMYYFLKGQNTQDGIAGFGETPAKAAAEFDKAWFGNVEPDQ